METFDPRSTDVWDLIVVGLGPAGVSAALQAQREGLSVLGVDEQGIGGLVSAARRIDNLGSHPGGISGRAFVGRLARSLADARIPIVRATVTLLETLSRAPGEGRFRLEARSGSRRANRPGPTMALRARAVCLATGSLPRELPSLWDEVGPWHRDIRSLTKPQRGRMVLVLGGGDAAFDTALSLTDRGARVLVLVRGEAPRATPRLIKEALRAGVDVVTGARVVALAPMGASGRFRVNYQVAGVDHDGAPAALSAVEVDGLVACIGREPRLELARPDESSSIKGLFFAGDVLRPPRERFIAPAMGDGLRVSLEAAALLEAEASEEGEPRG